jgi:hypothetical protein
MISFSSFRSGAIHEAVVTFKRVEVCYIKQRVVASGPLKNRALKREDGVVAEVNSITNCF